MKPKKINWEKDAFLEDKVNGNIGKTIFFDIQKVGVRKPKYCLKSFPICSIHFTRANNPKKLGEFDSVEIAKEKAQKYFDEFVSLLVE